MSEAGRDQILLEAVGETQPGSALLSTSVLGDPPMVRRVSQRLWVTQTNGPEKVSEGTSKTSTSPANFSLFQ